MVVPEVSPSPAGSLRVLVVDDDPVTVRIISSSLKQRAQTVFTASSYNDALLALATERLDVVLCDINLGERSGLDLHMLIRERHPEVSTILITAESDMSNAVRAMQQGAYDYLTKPVDLERLGVILQHLAANRDLSHRLTTIVAEEGKNYSLNSVLIGKTPQMVEIYKIIGSVSSSKVTVLILGESGTGKELIARAVHFNSDWKEEPFIAVNCTALTETLLESELFGHVKGSFTGATGDKQGKFELARGGTIFLDEIGEISPSLQVKLLRVLQQREFEPVGGEQTIAMRARIVAATNRSLKREVEEGRFREDLFYRLNVVTVDVPPLRQRREDIPLIVQHLLSKINRELHTKVWKVSDPAMDRILRHDWPGNVRELENVLTRAVVLSKSGIIEEETLPTPTSVTGGSPAIENGLWKRSIEDVEMEHIQRVLANVGDNRTEAARILGISKQTLYTKLAKLGFRK